MSQRPHFLQPLLASRTSNCVLRNARTGRVVANRVDAAVDSRSRRRGLLGREGLDSDATLVIAPCESVHTFFMRFVIDVVFVDRAGKIVKICRHLRPWRIAFALGAFATFEFAAGWADASDVQVGDQLLVASDPGSRA